jgi:hypothetical protein
VLRSSTAPYAIASVAEKVALKALHAHANSIVERHFAAFSAPSKKAEHAKLEQLGLTSMPYRQYLEHVRIGGTMVSASAPLRNRPWLDGEATAQGVAAHLDSLTQAYSRAKATLEQSSKNIVRKKIV